jgi:hypothetical protein
LWLPVGYHGRSSSIITSEVPVVRPKGQTKVEGENPTFEASARIDFELEMGFYTFDGNKLVETNIFSTGILDTVRSFDLLIEKNEAGYKQVIPEMVIAGVPTKIVEVYYKINFDKKADIDGVWKLDEYLSITNGDTARYKRDQYKIFQGGYFMTVQYFIDPITKAPKKGFGFGNFELGKQEITETNVFSSTPENRGVGIQTKLTRESEDSFTQTIVSSANGSTLIEKYKRMPKISKSTSNP